MHERVFRPVLIGVVSLLAGSMGVLSAPTLADSPADLVLLHGKIHTQDASRSIAQALTVRGNTIIAVGLDESMSPLIGANTRTVDLRGRVVLPGIIDAHVHSAESAQDLDKCSMHDELLPPAGIKRKVAACLKQEQAGHAPWFEVVMVNASALTLTRQDLDEMSARRPLLLESGDGHTAWANSAALRAAAGGTSLELMPPASADLT